MAFWRPSGAGRAVAALAAGAAALHWPGAAAPQGQPGPIPSYELIDLGSDAFPTNVDAAGRVIGRGPGDTFLWQEGQWSALGPVPAGAEPTALDGDSLGRVAGGFLAGGVNRAALWSAGSRIDLGTLAPGDARVSSFGVAIDASGRVVGYGDTIEGPDPPAGCELFFCAPFIGSQRAFLWQDGAISLLPSLVPTSEVFSHFDCEVGVRVEGELISIGVRSPCAFDPETEELFPSAVHPDGLIPVRVEVSGPTLPRDMNASSQVVGRAQGPGGEMRAVLWQGGSIVDLGPGEAIAINDAGRIVGTNGTIGFHWQAGVLTPLPLLAGCARAEATGINIQGTIVGTASSCMVAPFSRPILWRDGVAQDLNTLLEPGSGWLLQSARAINDRGQIVGIGTFSGQDRGFLFTPRRPVLLIPGIAGTFPTEGNLLTWSLARGADPDAMQLDPLARVYDDLMQTLRNVGYVEGKTLFAVKYDWRLAPGPDDGVIDGQIDGLSAAGVSDTNYQHAVDYLGEVLWRAAEQWKLDHPGQKLEAVDVIAHSTGGIVARTYIQSAAYGAVYGGNDALPRIENLIMLGVPNRGASKAWNPTRDNWAIDASFRVVLAKLLDLPYQKVVGAGLQVSGPDQLIDREAIQDPSGTPDPLLFIAKYVPTIRGLLATYDFLDCTESGVPGVSGCATGFTNVNENPALRNSLLLDLNAGLDLALVGDPNAFADRARVSLIYGVDRSTPVSVKQRVGAAFGEGALAPFTEYGTLDAAPGQIWYDDQLAPLSGDGTVPIDSSAGQFIGDPRVARHPVTGIDHLELMFSEVTQERILDVLGVRYENGDVSTDLHAPYASQLGAALPIVGQDILAGVLDPVEVFVVDGNGNRLGYSAATGRLTEIPGSFWLGDHDGIGWVFGSLIGPLRLELSGLGGRYYANVSVISSGGSGGSKAEGVLARGESRIVPIPVQPPDRDGDGISDPLDRCPYFASPDQTDTDGDGRGNPCECTDQNGDGRNTVADLVAINLAIFNPGLVTPLCDGNGDGLCNVNDLIAANVEIFSPTNTSACTRQPVPGP